MKTLITTVTLLLCLQTTFAQTAFAQDTVVQTDTVITVDTVQPFEIADTTDLSKIENQESEIDLFCRQEFSVWTSGGISALNYKPTIGERTLGLGGTFGMGYTFYFHRKWGIHSGLELALYNTSYRLKSLKDMYTRQGFDDLTPGWSGEDEIIDYHTELTNYTEKQRLYNINIPLMLQFQTTLSGSNHQFFAMGGAKLGIQLKSSNKVNTDLYTWYYDHKTNQEFRPDPADYGNPMLEDLGCFNNLNYTDRQTNKFKLAGLASVESGVKWYLNPTLSLYTGLYVDYGFTNIRKQTGNRFFEFDPVSVRMNSNSITSSQYAHNGGNLTDFTKKVSPLSFGVKIRLGINMCKYEKQRKQVAQAQAQSAQITHITQITQITQVTQVTQDSTDCQTHSDCDKLLDAYRKGHQDAHKDSVENKPVQQSKPATEQVDSTPKKPAVEKPVVHTPAPTPAPAVQPQAPKAQEQAPKAQEQAPKTQPQAAKPAAPQLPVVSASDPDLRYRVQIMATQTPLNNYRKLFEDLFRAVPELRMEVLHNVDVRFPNYSHYLTTPFVTQEEAIIIRDKIRAFAKSRRGKEHIIIRDGVEMHSLEDSFVAVFKGEKRVSIQLQ